MLAPNETPVNLLMNATHKDLLTWALEASNQGDYNLAYTLSNYAILKLERMTSNTKVA